MNTLLLINLVVGVLFFGCYAYQLYYLAVPYLKKSAPHGPATTHRFGVLICARNEEEVLPDLLQSLKAQTYDQDCLTVFVMADNCTDHTADVARREGAVVYTRFNQKQVGKGYALEQLLKYIQRDYPEGFDGYFVFDADNVLDCHFVEEMNKTFCDGYDIITSYRNSKNYGDNWISAGYALWFIRESRYLNGARMLLGSSCAVSGTGFFFSRRILNKMGGWQYHLLTEDIQFSTHQILQGETIGFCKDAELYDEQPITFRQSWRQRLRWAKGFLQVFRRYGKGLVQGTFRKDFSCYDMGMTIMPAFVLTLSLLFAYVVAAVLALVTGHSVLPCLKYIGQAVGVLYVFLYFVGAFTTVTQRHKIHTTPAKKFLYTFTFPVFMLTYLPISLTALVTKVQWKPIEHHRADRQVLEAAVGRK